MDHKQVVTERLAALGISLSAQEIDLLAKAHASLQKWETIVQKMLQPESEPAVTFHAKVEG
ncbi:MAG: hypothetical protein FJ147_20100 [Deltaproteobacteria bacterium]|nr:hypothetical protein [Deltaproteobacteria bacterium]